LDRRGRSNRTLGRLQNERLHKFVFLANDQIEAYEISGECRRQKREEKCLQSYGSKTRRRPMEDLGADRRIISKQTSSKWDGKVWICGSL
jgi:hypothetical protein